MSFHKKVMWVVVLFGRKGGTGMIEILKEESLEEREKRRLAGKQQMAVKKQDKESKDRESKDKEYKNKDKEYKDREGKENRNREKELLLPKNIRQVGDAGEYTKVYFEDYVMTYIKQQAALEKEKEIYRVQALNEGKPENIVEKMVMGRIQKYYKEVCLVSQQWVKDGDKTIAKFLEEKSKEAGAPITVSSFARFERGEGIEKVVEDFAAEVAAQMNK